MREENIVKIKNNEDGSIIDKPFILNTDYLENKEDLKQEEELSMSSIADYIASNLDKKDVIKVNRTIDIGNFLLEILYRKTGEKKIEIDLIVFGDKYNNIASEVIEKEPSDFKFIKYDKKDDTKHDRSNTIFGRIVRRFLETRRKYKDKLKRDTSNGKHS